MIKPKILIVEDEEKIGRFLELELLYEGYEVGRAMDGKAGLELFNQEKYDLVLLDVMLPKMNGLDVLRHIRASSEVPVILLTARDAVTDKVSGLDLGANDYITKPFATEELLARMRASLRTEGQDDDGGKLDLGRLEIDPLAYSVKVDGESINLTKREYELLYFLALNKGIVLSRDTLLEKVWGYHYQGETNVVDVYIRYLRSKIDQVYDIKFIHTVRGIGYVLKTEA